MESGYYNHEPSSPRNMESLRDRLSQEGEVRTRGTTLLSIHLFRFLCLLPAFFSTVSTIWVSPLQTDSMPGSSMQCWTPSATLFATSTSHRSAVEQDPLYSL